MLNIYTRIAIIIAVSLLSFNPLFSGLKSTGNQADYIIVYHPEFKKTINPIIERRQSQGLNVVAVSIDQIYAEFGDSATSSEALRNFLSYATTYWQKPAARYVLLAGSINHIPSYKVRSFYEPEDSISLDGWLVVNKYVDDGNRPGAAIGRLPARNASEMGSLVSKILYYEDHQDGESYELDNLDLIDSKDYESFESNEARFINSFLRPGIRTKSITRYPDAANYVNTSDIFSILNRGTRFINLFVHGSPSAWFYEGLITREMLDTIKLSNKPFILAGISCSQRFDDPEKKGIIEQVLTMDSGGAVATFASAGVGLSSSGTEILSKFFNEYYSGNSSTIGDIVLKIKREYISASTQNDDIYHRFTLLGDPAMRMPAISVTSVKDDNNSDLAFNSYPNPVSTRGTLSFSVDWASQPVRIELFDALGSKVQTIADDTYQPGNYALDWQTDSMPDGFYFCRVNVGSRSYTGAIVVKR